MILPSEPDHERISINVWVESTVDATVDEIWPDGDAPDVITADAVAAVMEAAGTKRAVLNEWWGLPDTLDVGVNVTRPNPAYHGDLVLLGEVPPAWLHERAVPWARR